MQISNEVGPHRDLKQGIDLSALSAWRVGSQSAPIGTPPQRKICVTDQYLAAVYGWGPASVLKHTLPLPYGPTGSRHAPCNRPDCPLLPCSTTIDWHPANWAPHLSQIYPRRGLESRHPSPDPQRAISSAVSVSRRDSRRTNSSLSAWSRVVAARRTSWSRRRRATSIAAVCA